MPMWRRRRRWTRRARCSGRARPPSCSPGRRSCSSSRRASSISTATSTRTWTSRSRHKDGKPITLRDLMNHRAGFEEGLKGILSTDPHGLATTEQYLKRHPRPLLFTPGEVPAYSNYGAALAGYIVQRVSGEPFERYVERHIFLPLGMTHTTFDQPLPGRFRPDLAQGYMTASGAPHAYELIVTRPAGSVTTTADDMSRFMIAHLQQGRLRRLPDAEPRDGEADADPVRDGPARLRHHGARFLLGRPQRPHRHRPRRRHHRLPHRDGPDPGGGRGDLLHLQQPRLAGRRLRSRARRCSTASWTATSPRPGRGPIRLCLRPRPGCAGDRRPLPELAPGGARLPERLLSAAADGDHAERRRHDHRAGFAGAGPGDFPRGRARRSGARSAARASSR